MLLKIDNKVYFPNLDVLRCVCAFMVVLAHSYEGFCSWIGSPLSAFPLIDTKIRLFISNLSIGVDVFFVISGFLITYLLLNEKHCSGNVHIGKFIIRRSLRIWPLYFFAIFFGFVLISFSNRPAPNYLANLFFLNNFNAIQIDGWQFPFAHFWSICVEEHFYIIWPIVLYFTSIKNVPFITVFLIGISILSRWYFVEFSTNLQMNLRVNTLARIDEILIGALVAWVHFKKPIINNIDTKTRLLVYVILITLLFVDGYNNWGTSIFDVFYKKYIYLGLIVFWMSNYLFNPEAFFNFKNKNFVHYLGKVSFGIYIYHNMLIDPFISKFVYRFSIKSFWVYELGYLVLVIGVSILSYELFEKYFLRLKQKFEIIKTER